MRRDRLKRRFVIPLATLFLALAGCGLPLQDADGRLVFPDFVEYRSIRGGVRGEIIFGELLVGGEAVIPLRIKNSGNRTLSLTSLAIAGEGFDFLNRKAPDFPLQIPSGEIRTVYIGFYPQRNGDHSGLAAVSVDGSTSYILMNGTGVWEVRLSIGSEDGEILAPVSVNQTGAEHEAVITTVDGRLQLAAEAAFLRKFSGWQVIGSPKNDPVFQDSLAAVTEVFVTAHTHIQAIFLNPWVFFPDPHANLQDAVNAVTLDADKEGVIILNGTHSLNYDVSVPAGVSLYGGYKYTTNPQEPEDRKYRSPNDRIELDFRSVLEFSNGEKSLSIESGDGITIEGLTIQRSTDGTSPVVDIRPGASPVLQYNTINSSGETEAVRIQQAAPLLRHNLLQGGNAPEYSRTIFVTGRSQISNRKTVLEYNDIRGGNTSAPYSRVYTVRLYDTDPVFFRNTITSGNAGGSGSRSHALYIDWENQPLFVGNQISGGLAPGIGGETYGIYFINNGKSTLRYNSIDAGSASGTAHALYSAYGTNYYLRWNNFSASGSSYGIYLGANGRVRRVVNNGFHGFSTGMQYRLIQGDVLLTVDDLNDFYNTDSNKSGTVSYTIPDEPGKQEWE
ncbi:right-handed parallel beta-helix repeat-containing protein [Spirochaeta dissipatitropha]